MLGRFFRFWLRDGSVPPFTRGHGFETTTRLSWSAFAKVPWWRIQVEDWRRQLSIWEGWTQSLCASKFITAKEPRQLNCFCYAELPQWVFHGMLSYHTSLCQLTALLCARNSSAFWRKRSRNTQHIVWGCRNPTSIVGLDVGVQIILKLTSTLENLSWHVQPERYGWIWSAAKLWSLPESMFQSQETSAFCRYVFRSASYFGYSVGLIDEHYR